MIYFDNAATGGQKPASVIGAACAAVRSANANPGRSGHALSVTLAENLLSCRKLLSSFFDGYGFERTVFTKNCTEALNAAVFGFARSAGAPVHVISTVMEHNSVIRPLRCLEREGRIELTLLPLNEEGTVSPADFARAATRETAAAVFTLASNVTGAAIDPAAVRRALPDRVLTICDGAQACGHIPVDMRAQGIDALCVAGHKGMHGIAGSGLLLFSERFDPAPLLYGGTGSDSANPDMPPFYPDRLEAGTLNYPAAMSLFEGAIYLKEHMQTAFSHIREMTRALIKGLREIGGIEVFSRPNPFGIVAFRSKTLPSESFAQELSDRFDIAVRGGLHCAPLMHEALRSENGLVRASLSEFNTPREVRDFLAAAARIQADSTSF